MAYNNTPDYLDKFYSSLVLAKKIETYWHNRGYPEVKVYVDRQFISSNNDEDFVYVIRSQGIPV